VGWKKLPRAGDGIRCVILSTELQRGGDVQKDAPVEVRSAYAVDAVSKSLNALIGVRPPS